MTGLDELVGASFGPFPLEATPDRVGAFVVATGEDQDRWSAVVPPLFANAALFAAAPALLEDERVKPFTRSLLHSEQSFSWMRRLAVGERLMITGTVEGVRARGLLNLVTFTIAAGSDQGTWLTGTSVFLMSDQAAATADDESEPDENDRPPQDTFVTPAAWPSVDDTLESLRCGASRADLMRYAAASQDSNPIHLDHGAARAAGLGGVIVHGLLMAAWVGRFAGRYGNLASLRLRFRNPLRPGVASVVAGTVKGVDSSHLDLDLVLAADGTRLVTATASVTP